MTKREEREKILDAINSDDFLDELEKSGFTVSTSNATGKKKANL